MTIPSSFSAKGLSITISLPLAQGGGYIESISDIVNDYSHSISANGGFLSANITIVGNEEYLENWLQYGLGRDVKVYGPQQQIIWEGYVNQVDVNMGVATFSRGPLSSIGNRVSVMYTPYMPKCTDLVADPDCIDDGEPITGTATETTIVEDIPSQQKYGIWEKVLNIGNAWPDDAESIRDLYLFESSTPEGNPTLSVGGGGDLSVKLSCRGYIDLLNYAYNYKCDVAPEETESIFASDKIIAVIEEEPNGFISDIYDSLSFNGWLVPDRECENRIAKTIIDDIVALGGGDDDTWTFGIYGNRKVSYSAIPTEVEYIYYKSGTNQQVETLSGKIVEPWDVLPCKWVAIPTFLTSFGIKIDMRNDPRVFFAEEVNYTAPDKVTISGAKVRKLSQYMAKLGLGGV